mgnify:CR=1 FL=1
METTMFFGLELAYCIGAVSGLLMCWVIDVIADRIEKLVNTRVGQWLITKLF